VLFRQGSSLTRLGLRWRWSDLAWGAALAGLTVAAWALHAWIGPEPAPGDDTTAAWAAMTPLDLVAMVGEYAKVQLVLVAFVIMEVRALSGSAPLAIAAAVGLQALSVRDLALAGIADALVRSVFYWRTGRATPLLLASVASGVWFWLYAASAP
jgi:hypothetical protein